LRLIALLKDQRAGLEDELRELRRSDPVAAVFAQYRYSAALEKVVLGRGVAPELAPAWREATMTLLTELAAHGDTVRQHILELVSTRPRVAAGLATRYQRIYQWLLFSPLTTRGEVPAATANHAAAREFADGVRRQARKQLRLIARL
jgi:hypothetical protein